MQIIIQLWKTEPAEPVGRRQHNRDTNPTSNTVLEKIMLIFFAVLHQDCIVDIVKAVTFNKHRDMKFTQKINGSGDVAALRRLSISTSGSISVFLTGSDRDEKGSLYRDEFS